MEWNNLDLNLRNSCSLSTFRNSILNFVRPSANSVFNSHNPKGIKFTARLRLGLSHLREHKFKHIFKDLLYRICHCKLNIESTSYHLFHCPTYNTERNSFLSILKNIDKNNLLDLSEPILTKTLLFGSNSFDINTYILLNTFHLHKELTAFSVNLKNAVETKPLIKT